MSDRARASEWLWAKTGNDPVTGEITHWLPLPVHLRDTAEIARLLATHRLSPQQRALIDRALPSGVEVPDLAWMLGGLHDIGKASPSFQQQSKKLCGELYENTRSLFDGVGLNVRDAVPIASQAELPHSVASEIIITRVLAEECGLRFTPAKKRSPFITSAPPPRPLPIAHQVASIAGSHHGMTAPESIVENYIHPTAWPQRLGSASSPWHAVQRHLTLTVIHESGVDFTLESWREPGLRIDVAVLSLLTGLVIQADWIASNQVLFPLIGIEESIDICEPSTARAKRAWDELKLPGLWRSVPDPDVDGGLRSRFGLPHDATARPGQRAAHFATTNLTEPALLILEDETGAGKTEAALLAAENLAAATGASGLFIGLPTQATTNAIFSRTQEWLSRLPTAGNTGSVAVSLAHGKAALNSDFRKLPHITSATDASALDASSVASLTQADGMPTHSAVQDDREDGPPGQSTHPGTTRRILRTGTHAWLAGRKKRLLADFVVGTVDQLLMAALKSRHVMLRHSGFANKVVVIDEAHAADSTMRLYLRTALIWLGRWGVPTIVLTATLPPRQKAELVQAYQEGRSLAELGSGEEELGPNVEEHPPLRRCNEIVHPDDAVYPLLTVVTRDDARQVPVDGRPPRTTALHELADDEQTLISTVRALTRDGGCIAVIRNSVGRVQDSARLLRQEFGDEAVTIAHARYMATDRAERDRRLLELFGKDGTNRPSFAIVVASQVVEQSLDVDFDAVITDMCPVDLLIQRLGRVHRHLGRERPAPLKDPLCFITGIDDWESSPPTVESDSRAVYGEHLILRSIAAVRSVCGTSGALTTPTDVPRLVHRVYGGSPLGPDSWQSALTDAAGTHMAKHQAAVQIATRWATAPYTSDFGLDGWLTMNDGDADSSDPYQRERGHVRDGSESIEVLLVLTDGTGWRTLDWLPRNGGRPIPETGSIPSAVAEAVANSSVRLPFTMARGASGDTVIAELEKLGRPDFQNSPLLRGQLILPLREERKVPSGPRYSARVGEWTVEYDRVDGLTAVRALPREHRVSADSGQP